MVESRPAFSLRQLAYFVAVVEHGNYRRAAEALNMSQPPLSQQMQLLEQQLETALFDRSARRVQLTLAGEEMLVQARRLLANAAKAQTQVREIGRGEAGTLRVGLTDEQLGGPSFERLLGFIREYPGVSVELSVAHTVDLVQQMEDGELEIALGNDPVEINMALLDRLQLPGSVILAAVSRDAAFENEAVDLAKLMEHPLIIAPPSCQAPFSVRCRTLIASSGIEPIRSVYSSNAIGAMRMVASGIGACFISEHMVANLPDACRPLHILSPLAQIDHVLLVQKRQLSSAADRLVSLLTQQNAGIVE